MGALVGAAFAARGAALATRAPRGRRARQRARGMAAPASAAELCGGAPLAAGDEAALRVGLRAVELACELTASVQVRVRARARGGGGGGERRERSARCSPRAACAMT